MEFSSKVAIVTGASSGIGRATALALARRGTTVVATARRSALLETLIDECRESSPQSLFIAGDLADKSFAQSLVRETVSRRGAVDILVNNAAQPMHRPLYEISVEQAEALMRTNFMSCLWTTFEAIPVMLRQASEGAAAGEGGCIVNVSSFAATVTPTFETIYAASKGAMNGFTQGLWSDLQGSGIHCALVVPGPIDTEIWDKFEDEQAYAGPKYPPELVADAIIEAIEHRRHEITVPKRNPQLLTARLLATILPSVIRKGVARMSPVPARLVREASARSMRGLPMGSRDDNE